MPFILFFEDQIDNTVARISAAFPTKDDRSVLRQYKKTFDCTLSDSIKYEMIKKATEYFKVALWMKSTDSVFMYVNTICCDTVLRTKHNVVFQKNIDFVDNVFSEICEEGDKKVISCGHDMRFIEHAICDEEQHIWMDVYKSPLRSPSGRICGTLGTGIDLSSLISLKIKEKYTRTESIEIPLGVILTKEKIKEVLEKYAAKT